MIVGLDFGTTNSIISYWDERAQQPATFSYAEQGYVPSAVVYEDGEPIAIGANALDYWEINHQRTELCRFFKPLLPLQDIVEWENRKWASELAPRKVTLDYIGQLLRKSSHSIERNMEVPISKLMVSVPELWHKGMVNTGAEELMQILTELEMPEPTLISEPVAAGAYYVWRSKLPLGEKRRVLICDMGGGTFDVSVCDIYRQIQSHDKISVVAFAGNDNAQAGVHFLHCILTNVYQKYGKNTNPKLFEFMRDLWKLDNTMQMDLSGVRLEKAYRTYRDDPEIFAGQKVFDFRDMQVDAGHVFLAFNQIEQGIKNVLKEIEEQLGANYKVDNILMVGGFSRYFMVRKTIADFFNLAQDDSKISLFSPQDSLYAIAKGATLIAAGQVEIRELYPHSIYYIAHHLENDQRVEIRVKTAGQSTNKDPNFSQQMVTIVGREFYLEGYILIDGKVRKNFKWPVKIPQEVDLAKDYEIGIEVDRSNLAKMVIKGKDKLHYVPLGELFKNGVYLKS